MAPDGQSNEDQLDRAYQAGQRQAEMSTQIASHERRLNAINGSVARGADNTAELNKKIDALIAENSTSRAVNNALAASVKDAAAKQISSRGFYIATASVVLTLMGVIAAVLEVVHP